MRVGKGGNLILLGNRIDRVERHEERMGLIEILQAVHPVGDTELGFRELARCLDVVPTRPDTATLGHEPRVPVQHRLIGRVGELTQELIFILTWVFEHAQRLVRVRGNHDVVKNVGMPRSVGHLHPAIPTSDLRYGRGEAHLALEIF